MLFTERKLEKYKKIYGRIFTCTDQLDKVLTAFNSEAEFYACLNHGGNMSECSFAGELAL